MPKVAVYDIENQQVGDIELNDNIFGVEVNGPLLHQAVVMQMASRRLGTHSTKTRAMVSRGGRRAPDTHAAVQTLHRCGSAAASFSVRIPVPTRLVCRANSAAWLSSAPCRIKYRAEIASFWSAWISRFQRRRTW